MEHVKEREDQQVKNGWVNSLIELFGKTVPRGVEILSGVLSCACPPIIIGSVRKNPADTKCRPRVHYLMI
jgi:hypothetical protein